MAQVSEFEPVDVVQEPVFVDGMQPPAEVFGRAGEKFAREKLSELA